ncbi:hypothetical protein GCM10009639_59290 [Kitasatospora putterlickiae]|uniref:Uncharacterized protein n=1 Tax=Kitasatospora putterlickiae TaxID=221725 RepID=A0ABP4J6H4_9ACTN
MIDAVADAPVGGLVSGGLVSGELVARYPEGGGPPGQDDPAANGGLPVGSPIPGLPGAVVVARPSRPWPYEDPTGADGAEVWDTAGGPPQAAPSTPVAPTAPAAPMASAPYVTPAMPSTPTHQRAEGAEAQYGPEGELRTPRVLPQRVRNASLAEQLREANAPSATPYGPPGPAGQPADDPSPQRSRATMAAIQHGTRTARAATPHPDAPSAGKEQQ